MRQEQLTGESMVLATVRMGSLCAIGMCALVACSRDGTRTSCFDLSAPGLVVLERPIDVLVRDSGGQGEALGATVVVSSGVDSIMTTGTDTLRVTTGYSMAGTYGVRVRRRFYRDTAIAGVTVLADRCTLRTTELPVTLQLSTGAPPLRALAILGADFLSTPGAQRQLQARFDANAGIPRTVVWSLSDTALARIDATGLVTARCSLAGGSETVTALATADATVRAFAQFSVAKQVSCP